MLEGFVLICGEFVRGTVFTDVFVGAIAFVPWLCVQLLAIGEIPGTLKAHYAYPVVLSIGWIGIALAIEAPRSITDKLLRLGFVATVMATTYIATPEVPVFFRDCIPSEFAWRPQPTRNFIALLEETLPLLQRVRADAGIVSLAPRSFMPGEWLGLQEWTKQPASNGTELLVFFRNGYDRPRAIAQLEAIRDPYIYKVPQTEIVVVTSGPSDPNLPISRLLQRTQM